MIKTILVVGVSGLELRLGAPDVLHCIRFVFGGHGRFVYEDAVSAISVHRAGLLSTIARWGCAWFWVAELFIVAGNYRLHVRGAGITDLEGVAVKYLAITVMRGEMFVD